MTTPPSAPPIDGLLPHGPAVRLVEAILCWDDVQATCRCRIRPASPWAPGRAGAPAVLAVEMAAQAAAAHEALAAGADAGTATAPGMLVRVSGMQLAAARLEIGADLTVTVRRVAAAGPLAVYTASVVQASREVASGTLSTYREIRRAAP